MPAENSKLKQIGDLKRVELLQGNTYSKSNQYDSTNKDALSDGDNKGRGEFNGSIGTKDDIIKRNKYFATNKYGPDKPYELLD